MSAIVMFLINRRDGNLNALLFLAPETFYPHDKCAASMGEMKTTVCIF